MFVFDMGSAKFHRLAVRRVAVGIGPRFLSGRHRLRVGQPLGSDEALQSGEPIFVVTGAVVRLTASGGSS
jgi:hypothetical protein